MNKKFIYLFLILIISGTVSAGFESLTFVLGKNYALKITGDYVGPNAIKVISFAMDPTGSAIGEGLGLVSKVSPSLAEGLQIAADPKAAAQQAALQKSLEEIAKQDPQAALVLSRSIELSNYAKEIFKEDLKKQDENIAEIETDKEGNTIVKRNGEDFATIPKDWEIKKEGDALIFKSNGKGTLSIGEYKITGTLKGDTINYEEKEGYSNLKLNGVGNLQVLNNAFENVKDGTFKLKDKEIVYGEFVATDKTDYEIQFNNMIPVKIRASKGSKVYFGKDDNKIVVSKAVLKNEYGEFKGENINLYLKDNKRTKAIDHIYIEGRGEIDNQIKFDNSFELYYETDKCSNSKVTCMENKGLYQKIIARGNSNIEIKYTNQEGGFKNQLRVIPIPDNSKIKVFNDDSSVFISKDPVIVEGKPSKINAIIGLDFVNNKGESCSQYIGSLSQICTVKNKMNIHESLKEFIFKHNEAVANGELGKFYGSGSTYASNIREGLSFGLNNDQAAYFAYLKENNMGTNQEIIKKVKVDFLNNNYKPGDITADGIKIPNDPIKTDCINYCLTNLKDTIGDKEYSKIYDKALQDSVKNPSTIKEIKDLNLELNKDLSDIDEQIVELKKIPGTDITPLEEEKERIKKLYNLKLKETQGVMGTELFKTMVKNDWEGVYYNPDVNNPNDRSQEHIQAAKIVNQKGTYYGIPIKQKVVNYRPTDREDIKVSTKKDESSLKVFECIPFGLIIGRGGQHSGIISCGRVFDAHVNHNPDEVGIFTMRDFNGQWEWEDGAAVFPKGDWSKYKTDLSSSPCGC